MEFQLPEELRMFKETLRRFVNAELIPVERQTVTAEGEEIKPEFLSRFQQRAKDLGIWMMEVPEEYGGPGLSLFQRAIVVEELSRTIALPARGEGITGPKRFITGANKAHFMQLMAATDRSKGSHGGISCFLVDMDTPGVKLGTSYQTMMGDRPWEIILDNVRVPATNLIGEEGKGFGLAQKWLGAGRIKHGARALGVAERCLEMATSYAKQRSTFGRPLADRQAIQWKLADMYIELQAARLLVYKAATRLDAGEDAREDCYVCKYYADEMAFRAADECMQIHGGIALTTDLPIEKMWRQQRSYRITEGASEVMKMVIARHVLKTYG